MKKLTITEDLKLDLDKLKDVLKKCKSEGFTPVIIYEIERDKVVHEGALVAVEGLAKALVGNCRSILVLSEANAVLHFVQDKRRENFIFVGEMTHEEAKKLLETEGASLTKEQMDYVFNTIGTAPQTMADLAEKVFRKHVPLNEYVDMVLSDAAQDLMEFPLKPILAELKEHPDGVSTNVFKNKEYKGVSLSDPIAVGQSMKLRNCILYRMELKQYQLQTTAHKTAIKSYVPDL